MKKLILLAAIIVLAFNSLSAQTMREVAVIDVNPQKLMEQHNDYYTEFFTSRKRTICKYHCIDLKDVVKPYTTKLSKFELKNLIVVAESFSGDQITASFADFNKDIVYVPPVLLFDDVRDDVEDTVFFFDKEGEVGTVDLSGLDAELRKIRLRSIHMQIKNISSAEKSRLFTDRALIFPQDKSTSRWIGNVKYLRLFVVKKREIIETEEVETEEVKTEEVEVEEVKTDKETN
ncbi:MAG: hypothetical protein PF588_06765 [Candidatus Kapabacteria bacterium]|jgi:hypothetical protein|nr:hypothetical protein [Candidatus Kapabacteria bacterium]